MEKEHLVEILIKLKNAYPLFYHNRSDGNLSPVAQVWFEHLGGYEDELIDKAVFLMIAKETEVPTIALVNRHIPEAKRELQRERDLANEELQARIRALSK